MRLAYLLTPLLAAAAASAAACSADPGQHEITAPGELLTTEGRLREPGWAPRQLLHWDPARVHDPSRLRQWDFFTILDDASAANLTLVDLGFVQAGTITAIDLATGEKTETSVLKGTHDDFSLSAALEGTATFTKRDAAAPMMSFSTGADGSAVAIDVTAGSFGAPPAQGALTIQRRPQMPYLSLATPFVEDPTDFFFEQKLPGMTADGTLTVGDRTLEFSGATAVMDWGRGQWPSELAWRWAAASGTAGGARIAFNFGEGFGDGSAATENLVVYDDVPTKLGEVAWTYAAGDPMADWTFASPDGQVSLVLHPIAPEIGGLDLGSKYQRVTKAYGHYSGTIVLDDGQTVQVDGLLGFAEQVDISW